MCNISKIISFPLFSFAIDCLHCCSLHISNFIILFCHFICLLFCSMHVSYIAMFWATSTVPTPFIVFQLFDYYGLRKMGFTIRKFSDCNRNRASSIFLVHHELERIPSYSYISHFISARWSERSLRFQISTKPLYDYPVSIYKVYHNTLRGLEGL